MLDIFNFEGDTDILDGSTADSENLIEPQKTTNKNITIFDQIKQEQKLDCLNLHFMNDIQGSFDHEPIVKIDCPSDEE